MIIKLTETLLGLEFLLDGSVNILDEQGVTRQLFSAHVELLSFFVSCLVIHWRCLAFFALLLMLRGSLNDILSDKLALAVVAKFAVWIEVRSRKNF